MRVGTLRGWVSIAALVIALAPASLVAAAPSAAATQFSGRVAISARSSFSVQVVIPNDVTVTRDEVTFSGGGGRWWGYLMHRDGDIAGRAMYELRAGDCVHAGCAKAYAAAGVQCWCLTGADGSSERLTRGTYTLYVLADRSPVTITFALPGASMHRIRRGQPLPVVWAAPGPAGGASGASPTEAEFYSAGTVARVDKQGGFLGLDMFRYQVVPRLPQMMGVCGSTVAPPTGLDGTRYQYPCNTAEAQGPSDALPILVSAEGTGRAGPVALVSESLASVYAASVGDIGQVYLGGYLNTTQPAPPGGLNMVWFDYRPGTTKHS